MALNRACIFDMFRYSPHSLIIFYATVAVCSHGQVESNGGVSDVDAEVVHVLAAGNDRIVWLIERRVERETSSLRLAYCRAADSEKLAFRPLRIPDLSGTVQVATVRDENLHVFFSDGTHMRFVPPGSKRPLVSHSVRGVEVGLPDRYVPRILLADASSQALYAVVAGSVAVQLPERVDDAADELRDDSTVGERVDEQAIDPEETDSEAVAVGAPFALVRYEGGEWIRDRWAPKSLVDGEDIVTAWVRDGQINLLGRHQVSGKPEQFHFISGEGGWSETAMTQIPPTSSFLGAGWISNGPALVVRETVDGVRGLRGYSFEDERWSELADRTQANRGEADRVSSAALMGPRVISVGVSTNDAVEVGSWSLSTGEELNKVLPVIALAPEAAPVLSYPIRYVLPFIVFAGVLIFVFVTRRDGGLFRVALGPTDQVAELQKRFFAFAIDLAITLPIWGSLLYVFMYDELAALSMFKQIRNPTPALELVLPVIGVVIALYGMVFELAARATPGKRIMGLKIVAEGGGRAKGGAIVARNLMRILEFQFPAVAILMFLTPSRQRLGDVVSRTLVVKKVSLPSIVAEEIGAESETEKED